MVEGYGLPSTLGLTELFSRLGIKGARGMDLDGRPARPVVTVADFSRTLTSEPIEARAISGFEVAAPGFPDLATIRIQPVGRAVVIEQASLAASTGPLRVHSRSASFAFPGTPGTVDVGGVATVARVDGGVGNFAGLGFAVLPSPFQLPDLRWYVAPGAELYISAQDSTADLEASIIFRELSQGQGVS